MCGFTKTKCVRNCKNQMYIIERCLSISQTAFNKSFNSDLKTAKRILFLFA